MHLIALSVYDNDNTDCRYHAVMLGREWTRRWRLQLQSSTQCQWSPHGTTLESILRDQLLPTSSSGNRYILTVSDYFTKWAEAIALPSKHAQGVAEALFKVIKNRRYSVVVHDCIGYNSVFHKHLTAFSHTIYCELQFFFYSSSCAWDYHKC